MGNPSEGKKFPPDAYCSKCNDILLDQEREAGVCEYCVPKERINMHKYRFIVDGCETKMEFETSKQAKEYLLRRVKGVTLAYSILGLRVKVTNRKAKRFSKDWFYRKYRHCYQIQLRDWVGNIAYRVFSIGDIIKK